MTTTLLLALTLTASLAEAGQAPQPAPSAMARLDARFAGWIGCWRLEDDLAGNGVRMCITPEGSGVRLQTVVGTQRGIDEVVIADGTARPIADSECKGTERAEWSKDGLRLFRTTDVTCATETPRTVKSVAFMANGPSWINVQHVTGSMLKSASVRVQRYRRAFNQNLADGSKAPQPTAPALPAGAEVAWSIDDVIEASGKVPEEALQAALSEVRHGFNLNKQTLVALDDAKVPESVIDLMIALTFPKRFVVDRPGGGDSMPIGISTGSGWFDPFMSPYLYGAMANCYSPWGYGYRSYYGMCGGYYGYAGYPYYPYYGWGYPGGGWVVVDPGPIAPGPAPVEGRVVNGRGYTQIRPRDPEPAPVRVSNGGNGTAAGYHGGGGGSSGVSSQGYSSGSSGSSSGSSSSGGSSGGRTAVPRPGGGN